MHVHIIKIKAESVKRKIFTLFEENKGFALNAKIAPLEDCIIMKLMTERPRDHFDAVAMIQDNLIDQARLSRLCEENNIVEHIIKRLEEGIGEIKKTCSSW